MLQRATWGLTAYSAQRFTVVVRFHLSWWRSLKPSIAMFMLCASPYHAGKPGSNTKSIVTDAGTDSRASSGLSAGLCLKRILMRC